jgi:hypothetical protein
MHTEPAEFERLHKSALSPRELLHGLQFQSSAVSHLLERFQQKWIPLLRLERATARRLRDAFHFNRDAKRSSQ